MRRPPWYACVSVLWLCATPVLAQPIADQCSLDTPTVFFGDTDTDPGSVDAVSTTITVGVAASIVDTHVSMNLTHTFIGDVVMTLASPDGVLVTLHDQGGFADADIIVTYNDLGILNGSGPYDCDCATQPSGPGAMADFNGTSTTGDWTIVAVDTFPSSGGGTIDGWCLGIFDIPPPLPISDLSCVPGDDTVALSWTLGGIYDAIEVSVNGALEATLAAGATSYTTEVITGIPQLVDISVEGVVVGSGVPVSCTLTVFGPGTLFIETFEDGDADGWTIVDEGTISGPSNWQVLGQQFVQLSNIYGPSASATTNRMGTFAVWDDPGAYGWSDYSATARLHATDNDGLGLMFYYQDSDNYYKLDSDIQRAFQTLFKKVNGVESTLATVTASHPQNQDFALVVTVDNGQIQCLLNGASIFGAPVLDDSLSGGTIALYCWGNTDTRYDDVAVLAGVGGPPYIRADVNGDGIFNGLVDSLFLLGFGFVPGRPEPPCLAAADADGDGSVNALVDSLYILSFAFVQDAPPPPAPYPTCGVDPDGTLACDTQTCSP